MNRQVFVIAAVATGIALVPAAAQAAQAPETSERTSAVVAGSTTEGNAVVYAVNGPVDNEFITVNVVSNPAELPESAISIAGTASMKKPTADGSASFEVTMEAGGTYTLVATGSDGDLIDSQVVTVVPDGTAFAAGTTESATLDVVSPVGEASGAGAAIGAGAIAVAGAGAVFVASRRRELMRR
ncbi:hypothetical protein [Sanguibacter antarcticus]|uniref:LPXTG-motif cell wall-anchored protein n=1 Tax=Sanguibacter antarcticus TaxID=372484 RepID=A0A2A9E0A8_9MICO|nr:hypothetical protein [Sanguibacter antarcticus]PFG32284.1 hypothetical protein ATL42_0104 [Sanguibacter antarcticus]